MPAPNVSYDDGLTKVSVDYVSDNGVTYSTTCRKAYIDAGLVSFTTPATSATPKPGLIQARHIHLQQKTPSSEGVVLRRTVPALAADIERLFAPGAALQDITIDGIVWNPVGFKGEKKRQKSTQS